MLQRGISMQQAPQVLLVLVATDSVELFDLCFILWCTFDCILLDQLDIFMRQTCRVEARPLTRDLITP